ncbi:hypothetical protein GOV14_05985 [Candidatus Pacearchaeota archaeon]|nr:hypothetical protein [Candidatus Pacearchaeota archaeon]
MSENDKIKIGGVCFTSEWMQYQFLNAMLNNDEISEKFALAWVSGKEPNLSQAEKRMITEIKSKLEELENTIGTPKEWRTKNIIAESKNLFTLLEKAHTNGTGYVQMNRNANRFPQSAYDNIDAVAIFTPNVQHLPYFYDSIRFEKPPLIEKPLAIIQDLEGKADRRSLEDLWEINEKAKQKGVIAMDAEHYSSKVAAKVFFDQVDQMVLDYGKITKVQGYILEKDNPKKPRTKALLSKKNQTGLLLDTGVHLSSMITGIGGKYKDITHAHYAIHSDYDVETTAHVNLQAYGDYFQGNVPVTFEVAKFIDLYKKPLDQEKKQVKFTFEKEGKQTTAIVNFKTGEVTSSDGLKWHKIPHKHHKLEYVNVLNEFYDCIRNNKQPRTSVDHSITGLDALCRTYENFPVEKNLKELYVTN